MAKDSGLIRRGTAYGLIPFCFSEDGEGGGSASTAVGSEVSSSVPSQRGSRALGLSVGVVRRLGGGS